jgi:hypothetical protein
VVENLYRPGTVSKAGRFEMSEPDKYCPDLPEPYTVPKAFSMHETFPKLLGKISKTTWKY